MGKSSSTRKLQQLARFINATDNNSKPLRPTRLKPVSKPQPDPIGLRPDPLMEAAESSKRRPLAEVVTDCVNRWFHDTLKEAKAGDIGMQVLVGQMYYSGYGVVRDAQKELELNETRAISRLLNLCTQEIDLDGRAWISRASKSRSSVWKVGDKHPGYNASDSDSDDVKEDAK